jgi:hypothetical protein
MFLEDMIATRSTQFLTVGATYCFYLGYSKLFLLVQQPQFIVLFLGVSR